MKLLFVSLGIFIIDQASKLLVKGFSIPFLNLYHTGMYPGQRIPLIGDILGITMVENPGIAFGIDFGSHFKFLISIFTIVATFGLVIYFYFIRERNFYLKLSIAIIIGGAFGNLVDRIFYGYLYGYSPLLYGKVVDFFDFRIFNLFLFNRAFGNYIFNIADMAVTAGVILLLFNFHKKSADDSVPASLWQSKEDKSQVGQLPEFIENKD
jgi:signal peptidase II